MATRLEISLLKRLSELEQEFLGKFEKQLHTTVCAVVDEFEDLFFGATS